MEKKKRRRCSSRSVATILGLLVITSLITTFFIIPRTGNFDSVSVALSRRNGRVSLTPSLIPINRFHKRDSYNTTVSKKQETLRNRNSSIQNIYFKRGKTKITNHNYSYLITGDRICQEVSPPFLLVLVLSVHTHIDTREAIRKTWGSISKTGTWPKVGLTKTPVKLVFLFGTSDSLIKHKVIQQESLLHGDIVQADFVDSYFNLTRKIVMGIHWAAQYCPSTKYILKADEDVFVHIPNLIRVLQKNKEDKNGMIYGHTHVNSEVLRRGRWAVSNETYPFSKYPTYACGNTYVISGHIASDIFQVSEYMPYLNIEDVFVTGIVRKMIRAEITDVIGFTNWFEKKPKPCTFHNNAKISATKVDEGLMYQIWSELDSTLTNCYKTPTKNKVIEKRPELPTRFDDKYFRDNHILYNRTSGRFYVLQ